MGTIPGTRYGEVWEHDGQWLFPNHPEKGSASGVIAYPTLRALLDAWEINIMAHRVRGDGTMALVWQRRANDVSQAHTSLAVLIHAYDNHYRDPLSKPAFDWLLRCVEFNRSHVREINAILNGNTPVMEPPPSRGF